MAKIKFKRTSTVGRRPTGLESGEIGINLADRKIFVGDDSGNIVQLGNDPITTERLEAKAGATITNGLTVSGNQSNTGNITVSGDVKSATSTVTGKATLGSVGTGALTATGVTTGTLTATGNTTLAETKTGPLESTTLNATGVATVASLQTPGAISAGGNAVITGKVNAGSVETVSVVATGDVKGATLTATGKATVGSIGTGAITASSLTATGDVKSATVTTTGKAKSGSVETGAITGSTITATGNVTTSAKITANEIELTKYDNFDSRYIKTGAAITNATKFSTPRKIAGVDFDGSADISIPAANVGALPAAGGALTGAVTSNSNFTTTAAIQGQQIRATYRMGLHRSGGSTSVEFIRPDIITTDALPATAQSLGVIAFKEGSKNTDIHSGLARSIIQSYMPADGTHRLQIDNRDNTGAVKNRMIMDSGTGLTRIDTGNFQAGTTTLGTTTTGNLTAGTLTTTGTITGAAGLTLNTPNAGIELGSLTTAGTPFIDFKVNGRNVDYDIRLIASPTSLSVQTPGTTLDAFNLTSTTSLKLHQTAASQIVTKNEATIIRDFGNGNVTLSAGRTATDDVVGGDLYLGYTSSGNKCFTKSVRLEAPMTWKNTSQLVNSSGKLVGASLDTEYLKLTGGALTGNITVTRSGTASLEFTNTAVDTSVALPATNITMGHVTTYENRAGTNYIRGRIETIVTPTAGAMVQTYVRDAANTNKVITRLESDTGLFNISTGGFRVAGSSTLVGAVTASGALTVNGTTTTKAINATGNASITGNITAGAALWVAGAFTADNSRIAGESSGNTIISRGGAMYTNGDGNSHLWFMNNAGAEKAVIYCGADKVLSIRSNNRTFNLGESNALGLYIKDQVSGESTALVRGIVDAGGHDNWRARSSGIQLDCPQAATSAYNIWKATKWGANHLAAMDVHMAGDLPANGIVRLLVGNVAYNFYGSGEFNNPGNISTNDVYIRSDERLKRNLVKIDSALDKVDQLNGYSYEKKLTLDSVEYDRKEVGLIAQQLREVLPEAVSEKEDSTLTISPSAVNALLVEAVKELTARVKALEAK